MLPLQVATVLVIMVTEKYIWQLKLWQKWPIGNQQIWKKKNLEKKNVKNLSILGQVTIQTNANKPFGNSQICMSRDQVELISLR